MPLKSQRDLTWFGFHCRNAFVFSSFTLCWETVTTGRCHRQPHAGLWLVVPPIATQYEKASSTSFLFVQVVIMLQVQDVPRTITNTMEFDRTANAPRMLRAQEWSLWEPGH